MTDFVVNVREGPGFCFIVDFSAAQMPRIGRQICTGRINGVNCRKRAPLSSAEPLIDEFVLLTSAEMRDPPRELFYCDKTALAVRLQVEDVAEVGGAENSVCPAIRIAATSAESRQLH